MVTSDCRCVWEVASWHNSYRRQVPVWSGYAPLTQQTSDQLYNKPLWHSSDCCCLELVPQSSCCVSLFSILWHSIMHCIVKSKSLCLEYMNRFSIISILATIAHSVLHAIFFTNVTVQQKADMTWELNNTVLIMHAAFVHELEAMKSVQGQLLWMKHCWS